MSLSLCNKKKTLHYYMQYLHSFSSHFQCYNSFEDYAIKSASGAGWPIDVDCNWLSHLYMAYFTTINSFPISLASPASHPYTCICMGKSFSALFAEKESYSGISETPIQGGRCRVSVSLVKYTLICIFLLRLCCLIFGAKSNTSSSNRINGILTQS